ncbi:MAG: DUF11 domain-containing protein, partial [Deltaproteobacteria bacterium]
GFGYWPGAVEPTPWATAYATHLLIEASEAGFPVAPERIDAALSWLDSDVEGSGKAPTPGAAAEEAYLYYVLAYGKHPKKARIGALLRALPDRADLDGALREARYLLMAALYLSGDRRYEADLKRPDLSPIEMDRSHGWTFYSDLRFRGLALSVFTDLFGRDPAAEPLADLVARQVARSESRYYTTQELAWALSGLGRRVEVGAVDFDPPVLKVDGRIVPPSREDPRTKERSWAVARASEAKSVVLEIPRIEGGRLWLVQSSEGVRRDEPFTYGGQGLRISRRYLDEDGEPLDLGAGLSLGDAVQVELRITNRTRDRLENLALVDRLPAGFEIENPRLGRGMAADWIDPETLWSTEHMNLRDDRLEVFGALEPGETRTVIYTVRATAAGRFTLPPASAEAMYDPALWARVKGRQIEIAGPWDDYL